MAEDADIYIINRENVVWLVENHRWDFSTVVIDELSSFKSSKAQRFKSIKTCETISFQSDRIDRNPISEWIVGLMATNVFVRYGAEAWKDI